MYKRILVPTDGSDTSDAGLREACKLAKDQGSHLRLIHVVDEILGISPQLHGAAYDQIIEGLRKAGGSILAHAEALAREEGLPAETQLVEATGRPAGELVIKGAHVTLNVLNLLADRSSSRSRSGGLTLTYRLRAQRRADAMHQQTVYL